VTRLAALQAVVFAASVLASTGCWEQWSNAWWPQMKWQKAVQAFELQGRPGDPDRKPGEWMPPDGTIPVGTPMLATRLSEAQGNALPNPHPPSLASLENGRKNFGIFCSPCHGLDGAADGPVAGPPFGKGPFVGVLPLTGPIGKTLTGAFTDGHIFWVIANGIRRMPSYRRVPAPDRWDIVNYVRYMNGVVQAPAPAAQSASAAGAPAGGMAPAPGGSK
jgi:hypothetical protein